MLGAERKSDGILRIVRRERRYLQTRDGGRRVEEGQARIQRGRAADDPREAMGTERGEKLTRSRILYLSRIRVSSVRLTFGSESRRNATRRSRTTSPLVPQLSRLLSLLTSTPLFPSFPSRRLPFGLLRVIDGLRINLRVASPLFVSCFGERERRKGCRPRQLSSLLFDASTTTSSALSHQVRTLNARTGSSTSSFIPQLHS